MATTVTKDKICDAAMQLAIRDGLLAMTLDNVAKQAGISKGGVMYHFPSKDELVRGVLDYFSHQCETMLMRRVVDDPEPRLRWARCMLDCLFPESAESDTGTDAGDISSDVLSRFFMAMLAGAVTSPAAMLPLREVAARMRKRFMSDPNDGMEQILVWLAIDGLFLWQFMGLIDSNDAMIAEVGKTLRARIRAKLEEDAVVSNLPQGRLLSDAASAQRENP
ncbi:MAG: TetR/AcrR family transcriptional regulator [Planctomycetaceae bacterium]